MIHCNNVVKRFKEETALKGISFELQGTGCFGFLGGNGAGKTTTIRIIAGLAKPTSGSVKVAGLDVVQQREQLSSLIGYLPQHPGFHGYMTPEEWMHWSGSLFQLDKQLISTRTEQLLKQCGMWEARRKPIERLSGGMKQRLGIAQAMINQPKLLILDEPVSALDPIGRHEVLQLIASLKQEMTIFMSSHILEDVEKVADKVVIIHQGEIKVTASMRELRERFSQPIIEVEVATASPELTAQLKALPWVSVVRQTLNEYRVAVTDRELAKEMLPRIILDTGATLVRYQLETSSLEDIFLRVVEE